MARVVALLALVTATSPPGAANAAPRSARTHTVTHLPGGFSEIVAEVDSTEATLVAPAAYRQDGSKIVYLNPCEGGELIPRGVNDARLGTSSIVPSGGAEFEPFPYGVSAWNQVVDEVRDILNPFGLRVVDEDPGTAEHFEVIVCGRHWDDQDGNRVILGIAPFSCGNVLENAISFAFAAAHGNAPRFIAETIAHEAGHTWSMQHLLDCEDPMTYEFGCDDKYFQDRPLACADLDDRNNWVATSCQCGGTTQNSYQTALSAFGPAPPTPPNVFIIEPADGSQVGRVFSVRTEVRDENGLDQVTLLVDGGEISSLNSGPYIFNAPRDLSPGEHAIEIRATDRIGAAGSRVVTVTVGEDCGCAAGESCFDGTCTANPNIGAGFGQACEFDAQCASGRCLESEGAGSCTQACSGSCPDGYACGGEGVCVPGEGEPAPEDGGGCRVGQGVGASAAPWLALLFALALRRRRR